MSVDCVVVMRSPVQPVPLETGQTRPHSSGVLSG